VVDSTGTAQERYGYDAYGKPTVMTSAFDLRVASLIDWPIRFGGLFLDVESTIYNARYRFENPALGVWLSRDLMWWEIRETHLYQFTNGNAIRWYDPWGLATEKECNEAKNAVQGEKWYLDLAKQFADAKCKMPEIICQQESRDVEGGTVGYYDPRNNVVRIVYGTGEVGHLKRTIVHELIHAFDKCKKLHNVRADSRAIDACLELRAYYLSGQCSTSADGGGYLKKDESTATCLLRQAGNSIAKSFNETSEFGAKDYLCCVWDICLCNKQMPGSGFYGLTNKPDLPKKPDDCKNVTNCDLILGMRGEDELKRWFKM
jgi:RHS repeat-associated protein